ncbi:hypothetical protein EUGRSUZ_G03267 [Eucalyptus grandis]|uniref:Uncharacterized protein n=2 Tax=Eucalyptus grandis TaxID=71139 RepID=A0ACC3KA43_EUCGR|nr:hypothetical protein EUGRSUZ_G03267 [Eucalyptus grandis]
MDVISILATLQYRRKSENYIHTVVRIAVFHKQNRTGFTRHHTQKMAKTSLKKLEIDSRLEGFVPRKSNSEAGFK